MPYLCTSSSESLRLTISWTILARKYVIHIKQHTQCKNRTEKLKPNRKLQFFLQNGTENWTEVIFCQLHTPNDDDYYCQFQQNDFIFTLIFAHESIWYDSVQYATREVDSR